MPVAAPPRPRAAARPQPVASPHAPARSRPKPTVWYRTFDRRAAGRASARRSQRSHRSNGATRSCSCASSSAMSSAPDRGAYASPELDEDRAEFLQRQAARRAIARPSADALGTNRPSTSPAGVHRAGHRGGAAARGRSRATCSANPQAGRCLRLTRPRRVHPEGIDLSRTTRRAWWNAFNSSRPTAARDSPVTNTRGAFPPALRGAGARPSAVQPWFMSCTPPTSPKMEAAPAASRESPLRAPVGRDWRTLRARCARPQAVS